MCKLKPIILGAALLALPALHPVHAADGGIKEDTQRIQADKKEIAADAKNIREDKHELRQDIRERNQDRRELVRAQRAGDAAAVERERRCRDGWIPRRTDFDVVGREGCKESHVGAG